MRRAAAAPALAIAAALAVPALAQDAGAARDRTGANAQPPPLPDYGTPAAPPQPAVPTPPPALAAGPSATLSEVRVATDGTGIAMPLPGWTPPTDDIAGIRLSHQPGQPLDGEWVRAQFSGNGLIGRPIDYARVVALIQAINRAYLANGYANSGVLVASRGDRAEVLDLRLVTGRVAGAGGASGLIVTWRDGRKAGLSDRFVAARMPSAASQPFNAFSLERDFRRLADNPAIRTIDAALKPGARPGEATLAVTVDPARRFDLYATVANNRSPAVGGIRYAVGGSLRNLLAPGDLISAEYGRTDGLDDALLAYEAPLFSPRTSLVLRGAFNDAAVVEPLLQALDIRSEEWSVEGGISHKLIDEPLMPRGGGWSNARSLAIGFLVVHRKTETELLGQPFSFSPGAVNGRAEYTALRLTQDYIQRGPRHVLAVSLTETLGIEGTRSTAPGSLSPRRHYGAVLLQASFARRLTRALELNVRLGGQYSTGTLYSGERFSIGGENSVRGYRENLLLVDRGVFGSLELGYAFSLTGGQPGSQRFDWGAFRVAAFADGALADNARAPEPFPRKVASVGGSLAWRPSDALFARVTYGKALRDATLTGQRHLQDRGWQFRVTLRPLLLF